MIQAIDCNFAQAAIHHHTRSKLPKGSIHEFPYNQQFVDTNLTTTYTVAAKTFVSIASKYQIAGGIH